MTRTALALLAMPLLLSGCVRYQIRSDGSTAAAQFQTVQVGPLSVTPQTVVEDSRCPVQVACVSAGRVRVQARVGQLVTLLTLGEPYRAPGGTLTLADVRPFRRANQRIDPADYRFWFRFTP